MAQQGTGNVKQTLLDLGNAAQARSRNVKGGTWRGTLIYALEKRLRERKKENCSGRARPHNLLNIAPWWACIFLLAFLPFLVVPRRSHPCSNCPHSLCVYVNTKETSLQTSKETNGNKSMLKTS